MTTPAPQPDTPPQARRFRLLPWWALLLAVALGAPGGYLLYTTTPDPLALTVTQVRIANSVTLANPSATAQEFVEKLKTLGSNPSLYLEAVVADQPDPLKTAVRTDTPIGNGLTFDLPRPIPLAELREVRVRDEGWFSNKMIDRVDVGAPAEQGQIFRFEMLGDQPEPPMPPQRLWGWVLVIAAGAVGLFAAVRLIALQVV